MTSKTEVMLESKMCAQVLAASNKEALRTRFLTAGAALSIGAAFLYGWSHAFQTIAPADGGWGACIRKTYVDAGVTGLRTIFTTVNVSHCNKEAGH